MLRHIKEDKGKYLEIIRNRPFGILTGFPSLDDMIRGIRPKYHIIAARPSVGKTSLGVNIAVTAAIKGHKILFFSIEMGQEDLIERILANLSGVNSRSIANDLVEEEDADMLELAKESMADLDIYVDYSSSQTPNKIRTRIKELKLKHSFVPDMVIIDYLQYMKTDSGHSGNDKEAIDEISRELARIVKDLEIPVIALAQLRRKENHGKKADEEAKPRLSELKGSGNLEQDADIVVLIHRKDYNKEREQSCFDHSSAEIKNAEFIISKNRQGPCGSITISWLPEIFKFTEPKGE